MKIATPLGGINVKTNHTSATDLGLPQYPGSEISHGQQSDKSANVSLGFGSWQLRVKVANYTSSDSQQKVLAFYRKALGSYGEVIECEGERPVGTPLMTGEGLTCDASGTDEKDLRFHKNELQLRAGSRHHQHLVVFKSGPSAATTEFSLIELELPHGNESNQRRTN